VSPSAHWRLLASVIESSMCGGDAAFCQITLTTCYSFLWVAPVWRRFPRNIMSVSKYQASSSKLQACSTSILESLGLLLLFAIGYVLRRYSSTRTDHSKPTVNRPSSVVWSAGLLVCLCSTVVSPAKTAKPIEMPFGLAAPLGSPF